MAINFERAKGNTLINTAKENTENNLNTTRIVEVPLDLIDANPDNEKVFNMDNIDALSDSIKDEGFSGAIEVMDCGNGRYEIVSGHRRYEATKLAGNSTIPVIILPKVDDIAKSKKLLSSNINNRELSPMDKARAIDYYIEKVLKPSDFKGNTIDECARFFHIGKTQVKRFKGLLKLIPELQDYVAKDIVPYSAIEGIWQESEEEQRELYNSIKSAIELDEDVTLGSARVKQMINGIIERKKVKKVKEPIMPSPTSEKPIEEVREEKKELPQRSVPKLSENDLLASVEEFRQFGGVRDTIEPYLISSIESLSDAVHMDIGDKKETRNLIKQIKELVKQIEDKSNI